MSHHAIAHRSLESREKGPERSLWREKWHRFEGECIMEHSNTTESSGFCSDSCTSQRVLKEDREADLVVHEVRRIQIEIAG